MFDKDTLIVGYDVARGEPRGARSRKVDSAALGLGACVDCSLCVQVCPTGIDIRKGLQYECIGCAACIDVCDTVMDKMNYPRGLIRYSTQNGIANGWTRPDLIRRVLRPRVLVYTTILCLLTVGLAVSLFLRVPLKVDVVADRTALGRMVEAGRIENVYRLQVMNATESPQRYRITAQGLPGLQMMGEDTLAVDAAQSRWMAIRLQLPPGAATPGSHRIRFAIQALESDASVSEKSIFLIPR